MLTTWHPPSAKVGANFADKRRSLGRYSSLADSDHGVFVYLFAIVLIDRLCGLVVRVIGCRSGGPGSIPGTIKKSSGSGTGSTEPRKYN
jgi:hypothetical protein